MKKFKKLISVMLTVVMALAMSMTAFATEPEETPQDPKNPTHTYEIYQIFTGDYANDVLSNIKWGANGTGTTGQKVDKAVLDELEAVKDEKKVTDTQQLAVIQKYANLNKGEGNQPVATGSGTTYTGLKSGYYLVKDQDGSLTGTEVPYTLYVVQVVNNTLTFTPKGEVPTVDKKILEGTDKVENNEASIGDEVTYEITGTMPSNIAQYTTYFYQFTDTLSKGLTYKADSASVKIDGKLEQGFTIDSVVNVDGTTTINVSVSDIKSLATITKDTKVVLTYTAILNEDAVIAGEGNPNIVKLIYSNDPNHSGAGTTNPTGETPESKVVTYTTELTILKKNGDGAFLPETEFKLTGNGVNVVLVTQDTFEADENGEYWKLADNTYTKVAPVTDDDEKYDSTTTKYRKTTSVVAKGNGKTDTNVVGVVQADGTVTFKGLGAGSYTITESKTLPGYNTIDPINFMLTFNKDTKKFSSDNKDVTVGNDNMLDTSIVNQKGSELPSTGGIGTTIFYVVGALLMIGAGIMLVSKRRMVRE